MKYKTTFLVALLAAATGLAQAQAKAFYEHRYSIDELVDLTLRNNQQLKLSAASEEVSRQRVQVAKLQQLPNILFSASVSYLGDATILGADFSKVTSVSMPHFGNSLTLQASQLVFKGFAVRNGIEAADLQQQIASLNLEKNRKDVKLLVIGYYLEMYRLRNQLVVYRKNINLSELRLKNTGKMHQQGLVTQNDIIRTRLMISNLNQACTQLQNSIDILNRQLTVAAGLPASISILPDTTILTSRPKVNGLDSYQADAAAGTLDVRISQKSVELAKQSLSIARADRMPVLSLFAGNSLSRPISTSTPVVDLYTNGWQVGATLSFNIASLYNAPRTIKLSQLQLKQSEENLILQQQNTAVGVHTAYLRYLDAVKQQEASQVNLQLAEENYRMTEKKYLNQLALLLDMLDATNAKLDAELQQANAQIGIVFSYYKLLNAAGKL